VAAWLIWLLPAVTYAQDKPAQDKPIGEAPEERDADEIFLRNQRVLLGPGQVVLDFGQFYSRADDLQLAVVNNGVALATREQTALSALVVGRVGIGRETEVFAATSFTRRRSRIFVDTVDLFASTQNTMGDVGVGIRHTFLKEGPGRPDIIGTFDALLATDDNPYVLGGGLVFVKSIDPVALFAGMNYHRSVRRDRPDGTRLEPATSLDVSLGYALGLNDTIAISTVATGAFIRPTSDTSRRVDFFSLRFALTSYLAKGMYIEPSVSIGLSGPGQSLSMGVTVPYAF
jgi:hypothetical protein